MRRKYRNFGKRVNSELRDSDRCWKRFPLPVWNPAIGSIVSKMLDYFLDLWRCNVTPELARRALDVQDKYGISFYDALIVATAESLGCHEILTEDLNDGQTYCGMVAVNPFK